ncbi:MAG: Uma2 family endonuclease [Chloroflexi bacterium]|nr:Uma2 family endonuclease [Chloroflexota bacterium]
MAQLLSPEKSHPTWEIAYLYPDQGSWSEEEYLALETNRLVEYTDGYVEILPMPTQSHQLIVAYLHAALTAFVKAAGLGCVLFAPFRVQLWPGKYREPDILFMSAGHEERQGEQFWQGADLVMEVISPNDRERDEVVKKEEYARAGIAEYWLVDPQKRQITVYFLQDGRYAIHGLFKFGDAAMSALLPGFSVEVSSVFDASQS